MKSLKELLLFPKMAKVGLTFSPLCESAEPDISNLQVLGVCEGFDESDAYQQLITENPWIKELGYKDIISYELAKKLTK